MTGRATDAIERAEDASGGMTDRAGTVRAGRGGIMAATMAVAVPRDHHLARRRTMSLARLSRQTGARIITVCVSDLTTAGCRVAISEPVETASLVWLKIAGLAPHKARVEHHDGEHYDCEFVPPVQAGLVEDALSGQDRTRRAALKAGATRFGRS